MISKFRTLIISFCRLFPFEADPKIQFENMENEVLLTVSFFGRFYLLPHSLFMKVLHIFGANQTGNRFSGIISKGQLIPLSSAINFLPDTYTPLNKTNKPWLILQTVKSRFPFFDVKS